MCSLIMLELESLAAKFNQGVAFAQGSPPALQSHLSVCPLFLAPAGSMQGQALSGPWFMTRYFPKAPSPDAIRWGVRASTEEWGGAKIHKCGPQEVNHLRILEDQKICTASLPPSSSPPPRWNMASKCVAITSISV